MLKLNLYSKKYFQVCQNNLFGGSPFVRECDEIMSHISLVLRSLFLAEAFFLDFFPAVRFLGQGCHFIKHQFHFVVCVVHH